MRCEDVRAELSAAADGAPAVDVADHVAGCAGCTSFDAGIRSLRSALRFEVLDDAPDVVDDVLARLATGPRRRPRLAWVAAVVAGLVAGATFAWPSGDGGGVAVAALPARIVAAQADLDSMTADLAVVERGGGRRPGTLAYRAPETLRLTLGTTSVTVDAGRTVVARAGVPAVERSGLEPFAAGSLAPLELVLPASAFTAAAAPQSLGTRRIDGREAVGVRVPAAQVADLLEALRPGGDGRPVNPVDDVDLWLDRRHLVPLDVVVRAGAGPDRARWAAARGLDERAGDVIVEGRLSHVVVNRGGPTVERPAEGSGFVDGPADAPSPAWLPAGMRPYRQGAAGDVAVRTWTDGRAWIKVSATRSWIGKRLFGDVGIAVRPVGGAYVSEDGTRVAVHAEGIDLVVTGSVEPAALRRVAASLGVAGRRVPADWAEASTTSLTAAE
ncbi:MAG: hypothetical protein JWO68_3269, partial [Actinomycetia bacterium]|nr:hypothetical protein [Actinomycetes bacterium]